MRDSKKSHISVNTDLVLKLPPALIHRVLGGHWQIDDMWLAANAIQEGEVKYIEP